MTTTDALPAVDWYFDFISPYAYLQSLRLPALATHAAIRPVPILFAAVLDHAGHKGPAEIPLKRDFTYRFVTWQAEQAGVPLRFPPAHPFNPLPALRLCVALGSTPEVIAAIFALIWRDGAAADTAAALAPLAARFGIDDVAAAIAAPAVKDALRRNTEAAIARDVFGVPTFVIDGEHYWGNDATAMFERRLADPTYFSRGAYAALSDLPVGARRG